MFLRCASFAATGLAKVRWLVFAMGLLKVDAAAVANEVRAVVDARSADMMPRKQSFETCCRVGSSQLQELYRGSVRVTESRGGVKGTFEHQTPRPTRAALVGPSWRPDKISR